jgi:nucleoid-associated protein YgaU
VPPVQGGDEDVPVSLVVSVAQRLYPAGTVPEHDAGDPESEAASEGTRTPARAPTPAGRPMAEATRPSEVRTVSIDSVVQHFSRRGPWLARPLSLPLVKGVYSVVLVG